MSLDLKEVSYLSNQLEVGEFKEIDFLNYAKHINKDIINLIVPGCEKYLISVLKESCENILKCIIKLDEYI